MRAEFRRSINNSTSATAKISPIGRDADATKPKTRPATTCPFQRQERGEHRREAEGVGVHRAEEVPREREEQQQQQRRGCGAPRHARHAPGVEQHGTRKARHQGEQRAGDERTGRDALEDPNGHRVGRPERNRRLHARVVDVALLDDRAVPRRVPSGPRFEQRATDEVGGRRRVLLGSTEMRCRQRRCGPQHHGNGDERQHGDPPPLRLRSGERRGYPLTLADDDAAHMPSEDRASPEAGVDTVLVGFLHSNHPDAPDDRSPIPRWTAPPVDCPAVTATLKASKRFTTCAGPAGTIGWRTCIGSMRSTGCTWPRSFPGSSWSGLGRLPTTA